VILRWTGAVAAAVALLSAATPQRAPALEANPVGADAPHTQLEDSNPAEGSRLTAAPDRIRLRFSTAVQLGLSEVRLFGPDGRVLRLGGLSHETDSTSTVLIAAVVDALPTGAYRVAWSTAGPDSHPISGDFSFLVEASTQAQAPPPIQTVEQLPPDTQEATASPSRQSALGDALGPLGLSARWFGLLSSVLLIGISVFHGTVIRAAQRRGEAEAVADFLPRLRGYAYVVATAALAAWGLRLADGLSGFGMARAGALLFGSPWGVSWWLFGLGAIFAFLGVRRTSRTGTVRTGWRLLAIGGFLTAASGPFAGHGWSSAQRAVAAPVHLVHSLAAGVWLGSLAVLVLVALPFLIKRKDSEGRSPEAAPWVASFSRVALIGVLLLLATGVANSWVHVGGPRNLVGTLYGRTLLVKTALLLLAGLLGLYNWRQVRPALEQTGRPGLLKLPATVELLVGFAVLLVTAILLVLSPPL